VSAGTTTTGANSELQGSILSGAAITLAAGSKVTGDIEAKAAIIIGAGSVLGGSILSGAAITLGAATRVAGDIFAKAAITIGVGCSYNVLDEAPVESSVTTMLASSALAGTDQPQPTPDPLTMAIEAALTLVSGELGGRTVLPGAYKTDGSATVAAGTVVTLRGNADSKFLFLSGASIVTSAGTTFNLVSDSVETKGSLPLTDNIFFVSSGATTTGGSIVLQGSIRSGAAITLGAASVVTGDISAKAAITLGAASRVAGDIFAKAAITVGAGGSSYNSVLNEAQLKSSVIAMHYSGMLADEQQPLPTPDPLTLAIEAALTLVSGELGGRTILPGAYKTDGSITVSAGTVVTLRGNAGSKFLFLSGATILTGAGTTFNLVSDSVGTNGSLPLADNIFFRERRCNRHGGQ
jgi:predicted acyltransferase (DUF342 family)